MSDAAKPEFSGAVERAQPGRILKSGMNIATDLPERVDAGADFSEGHFPEQVNTSEAKQPEHKALAFQITSKMKLYEAYMPFIKGGGLFIQTNKPFILGEKVVIMLDLLEEHEKLPLQGEVCWITPLGAQGSMSAGIGVSFLGDEAKNVRNKIETILAGIKNSDKRTDTM